MPVGEPLTLEPASQNSRSVASGSRRVQTREDQCGLQGQGKPQASRLVRPMHRSTLTLGDQSPMDSYTTTHTQSYSAKLASGQPLMFHLPHPSFQSQHLSQLDLSNGAPCLFQSHTKEVHGPKDITPRADMSRENWERYRGGQALQEVLNPAYWTTHQREHLPPVAACSAAPCPSGRPTQWHQHNILTGEQKTHAAGPQDPRRQSGDRVLWAARRRETDCCALRLY